MRRPAQPPSPRARRDRAGSGPTTGSARSPARDAGRGASRAAAPLPRQTRNRLSRHGRHHQLTASRTSPPRTPRRPFSEHGRRRSVMPLRRPANREHIGGPPSDPDAPADPADSGPAARWPAPNPPAEHTSPAGQQARHEATARQAPWRAAAFRRRGEGRTRHGEPERPAAAAADWRDQVLSQARQPWQPGPAWPHHPAIHRPPQADTPGAGIEPGR